jgi:HEAT repeat protein
MLRELINDKQPYAVVAAAIGASARLDYDGAQSAIEAQAKTSENGQIRGAALTQLLKHNAPGAVDAMFDALKDGQPEGVREAGINALSTYKGDDPRLIPTLRYLLKLDDNFGVIFQAIDIIQTRNLKELLPDLQALRKRIRFGGNQIDTAIQSLQK